MKQTASFCFLLLFVAEFSYQRDCGSIDNVYSFTYTGGTSDNATFYWNFGDANPAFSTSENSGNIRFSNTGVNEVILTIERYGCIDSYSLTIDVPVVTCGNGKKVLICHVPPGNPDNPQTICVSPAALPAHLAHGSCVGPCFTPVNKSSIVRDNEYITDLVSQDIFIAYPNPFKDNTTISFTSSVDQTILLEVYNFTGQKVTTLFDNKANAYQHYKVELKTENYPAGIYLAVLKDEKQNKVIKLSIVK
jgi:PKD repeat protein